MALRLRFTRRAASETERIERWRRANRTSAPDAFRDDLKAAIALLIRKPGVGVQVTNSRLDLVRRIHVGRVRYFVYHRNRADELIVLTAWHSS